jgi:hypothetical protein
MMTPRGLAEAGVAAALCGVAGMVAAAMIGSLWLAGAALAVTLGGSLLPSIAKLWAVNARSEAARQNQTSAGIEPGRDVQPDFKERLGEIKAHYARLECEPEGGVRFRELVAAEDEPGWHRLH